MRKKKLNTDKKVDTDFIPQVSVKKVPLIIAAKFQAIAGIEGVSNFELYNLAFAKFIELYEAKNGKVKILPMRYGLEGL